MFGKKKAQETAQTQEDKEFEAKYAAKQERRKVEKMIVDADKTVASLIAKAAAAKQKGQAGPYNTYVSLIKVTRAKKKQAETFLAQVDAMETMQSLTKSSQELLGSMGNIMNSLGKLALDKGAVSDSQQSFNKAQRELEKQSMSIESFLSSMEMRIDESDDSGMIMEADSGIDSEIDAFILSSALDGISAPVSSGAPVGDLDEYKKLMNS